MLELSDVKEKLKRKIKFYFRVKVLVCKGYFAKYENAIIAQLHYGRLSVQRKLLQNSSKSIRKSKDLCRQLFCAVLGRVVTLKWRRQNAEYCRHMRLQKCLKTPQILHFVMRWGKGVLLCMWKPTLSVCQCMN